MVRINARRYTENRHTGKFCQYCNWYLKKKSSCRVIEPGEETEVGPDSICRKFERRRGEEKSSDYAQVEHQILR